MKRKPVSAKDSAIAPVAPFSQRLLMWFAAHGRHDLPWQHPRTPYRVWLAEVMLQQTQVTTVIPYFEQFIAQFPDWAALAAADQDAVLKRWAGLGYYARARNLHRAAQVLMAEYGGQVPADFEQLHALPGLGRSTTAAILAQAFDQRHAILDGNVRRVLARHAAVPGWPGLPAVTAKLWSEAEHRLPPTGSREGAQVDYAQALMDLGATLCKARQPACERCPVAADCVAFRSGRVAEFPAPRPKRERPARQSLVLLIENADGDVLLERRPPSGIWGGLWCPPLFSLTEADEEGAAAGVDDADWRAWLLQHYAMQVGPANLGSSLHHAFTHFDLELRPLRARVTREGARVREGSPCQWTALHDLPGLPTPIAKLLNARQLDLGLLAAEAPSTATQSFVQAPVQTSAQTLTRVRKPKRS